MLDFDTLAEANILRQLEIDPQAKLDVLFKTVELAGECGEACNVVKKLERERLGIMGSRDTVEHLANELADIVICTSILANYFKINLGKAIVTKFNAGTDSRRLKVRLPE